MKKGKRATDPNDAITYAGFNCQDMLVNTFYLGVHAISKNKHQKMIDDYIASLDSPPLSISKIVVASTLDVSRVKCDDYIYFNTGDSPDDEITVVLMQGEKEMDVIGRYSVHFFRGIQSLFPIVSPPTSPIKSHPYYEFTKALNSEMIETLVMKVINQDNVAVYYGDLTNMIP